MDAEFRTTLEEQDLDAVLARLRPDAAAALRAGDGAAPSHLDVVFRGSFHPGSGPWFDAGEGVGDPGRAPEAEFVTCHALTGVPGRPGAVREVDVTDAVPDGMFARAEAAAVEDEGFLDAVGGEPDGPDSDDHGFAPRP